LRSADAAAFQAGKNSGILGLGIGIVMLFLAFIVLAGIHFEYWRVPTYGMITHQYAFIYTMCLMAFLLFVERPEAANT
jgi:predicted small integral membrane protein